MLLRDNHLPNFCIGFLPRLKYDINLTNCETAANRLEQIKTQRGKALGNICASARKMKTRYEKNRLRSNFK